MGEFILRLYVECALKREYVLLKLKGILAAESTVNLKRMIRVTKTVGWLKVRLQLRKTGNSLRIGRRLQSGIDSDMRCGYVKHAIRSRGIGEYKDRKWSAVWLAKKW